MRTIMDIFSKEISAVDRAASLGIYYPGYIDGIYTAWIPPGALYALLLTEGQARELNLVDSGPVARAPFIAEAWKSSRICTDFISRSIIIGGTRRKLWFNVSRDAGGRVDYPLANNLFTRLKIRDCDVFQDTSKPYGYFLVSESGVPYTYIMPVRLAPNKKEGV